MKSLKTILSTLFILLAATNAFSQTDSKDVSITSIGSVISSTTPKDWARANQNFFRYKK